MLIDEGVIMDVVDINPPELPALTGIISHGIVVPAAGLIYTSGQVAWDAAGALVGGDDLAAQFAKAYENVEIVLHAAGSSRERIVKETIHVVGYSAERSRDLVGLLAAVRQGSRPPASTMVGVESLFAEGFLVEIEAVAVI